MERRADVTEPLVGLADRSGLELRVHRFLEAALAGLFESWGYEEIAVPILEPASSYSEHLVGNSPWPEWDSRSVIQVQLHSYAESYSDPPVYEPAVLVPEGTVSVSRWIAKEHAGSPDQYPKKIFYVMPCFRNELLSELSPTKGRQFHQAGVEVLGTDNVHADVEVLLLAHLGLVNAGIPAEAIVARVGSASLFGEVCRETGLSGPDVLIIKNLLDKIAEARAGKQPETLEQNIAQVLHIVASYPTSDASQAKWVAMTRTHVTGIDAELIRCFDFPDQMAVMQRFIESVSQVGISCVFDPAVVRSHEYYTGIVYELDVRLPGQSPVVEVAGGGRYNRLIGRFLNDHSGQDAVIPAVGFAFGIERIASIIQKLQNGPAVIRSRRTFHLGEPTAEVVVVADDADLRNALDHAEVCRQRGERADLYVGDDKDPVVLAEYARRRGARLVTVER